MKILSLYLQEFRQHRDSLVEFGSGLTAILGANGTGKSTLLEAIAFCPFGEQRGDKDSLSFLWSPNKKFKATLRFELDSRVYEVMRSHDSAWLKDVTGGGDRTIATSLSEVTVACQRLLGLTYDEFMNSFFCKQKEIAFLNFKSNAETQKKVNKMLGYDRVQTAEDMARERAKAARIRVEALASVMGDISQLKADVAAKESEVTGLIGEVQANSKAASDLAAARPAAEEAAARAKTYTDLTQEIAGLVGRHGALTEAKTTADTEFSAAVADVNRRAEISKEAGTYSEIETDLAGIRKAKSEAERRTTIQASLGAEKTKLKIYDVELGKIPSIDTEELRKSLAESKSGAQTIRTDLDAAVEAWRKERSTATAALATAEADLRNATRQRKEAEDKTAAGLCPGCGQPFPESMTSVVDELSAAEKTAEAAVDTARAEAMKPEPAAIAVMRKDVSEADSKTTSIEQRIADAQESATKRAQIESKVTVCKSAIAAFEKDLADLSAVYDSAKEAEIAQRFAKVKPIYEEHQRLAGADDRLRRAKAAVDTAVENLAKAKESNDTLRVQRKQLGFETVEAAEAATAAVADIYTKSSVLESEAKGLQMRKQSAETALTEAKSRIDDYKQREAELESAKADKALNDALASEMKALRLQLNASIVPELSARASEILSILTGGRYTVLELDDKFNVSLIDDGQTKTVISGGEEDVKDIALRLSLCGMIQERKGRPMSLLILDEIFGSLDADRRQAVVDCLIGLKGLFDQIVLISHIEGTSEVADHCIYLHRDPETRATVVGDGPEEFELTEVAA